MEIPSLSLLTADGNLPEMLWNTILGLTSEIFFSGTYARPFAKRDGVRQWMKGKLHVEDSDR